MKYRVVARSFESNEKAIMIKTIGGTRKLINPLIRKSVATLAIVIGNYDDIQYNIDHLKIMDPNICLHNVFL